MSWVAALVALYATVSFLVASGSPTCYSDDCDAAPPAAEPDITLESPPLRLSDAGDGTLLVNVAANSTIESVQNCDKLYFTVGHSAMNHNSFYSHQVKLQHAKANASGAADQPLVLARVPNFPSGWYCVQLGCNCLPGSPSLCQDLPEKCPRLQKLPGIVMSAWQVTIDSTQLPDGIDEKDGRLPHLQVQFKQHRHKFPRLRVQYAGCADGRNKTTLVAAGETLLLHKNCQLAFGKNISLEVEPDEWFCKNGGVLHCHRYHYELPALQPQMATDTAVVFRRPGIGTGALFCIVAAALLTLVAVIAAVIVCRRRARLPQSPSRAPAVMVVPTGGRPSVLLLHLATTDAEHAAVTDLTAALQRGGADVVTAHQLPLLTEVTGAAARRVCVLMTAAAAAAVAASGVSRRQRQFAAAVRHLMASTCSSSSQRVCQACLAGCQPLLGLSPGVSYILPEHTAQLVHTLTAPLPVE